MLVDASVARPLRLLFVRRRVVADAVPVLAALLHLVVPGPASGLGLHQPVGHSPLPPAGSAPASGTLGVFRVPMPLAHPGDRHALEDSGLGEGIGVGESLRLVAAVDVDDEQIGSASRRDRVWTYE